MSDAQFQMGEQRTFCEHLAGKINLVLYEIRRDGVTQTLASILEVGVALVSTGAVAEITRAIGGVGALAVLADARVGRPVTPGLLA